MIEKDVRQLQVLSSVLLVLGPYCLWVVAVVLSKEVVRCYLGVDSLSVALA